MFDNITDIIAHVRRKYSHQVYVGKGYSVTDLCNDLITIEARMQQAGTEKPEDLVDYSWLGADEKGE